MDIPRIVKSSPFSPRDSQKLRRQVENTRANFGLCLLKVSKKDMTKFNFCFISEHALYYRSEATE
jgi:hypothetical protein